MENASFFETVKFYTYSIGTFVELLGKRTKIACIVRIEKKLQQEFNTCFICEQVSNHVGVGGWGLETGGWSLTVISYQLSVISDQLFVLSCQH